MTWQEPYFFVYRSLGCRGLLLRLGIWLACAIPLAILVLAIGHAGRAPHRGDVRTGVLMVVSGLVAFAWMDLPNIRRTVTVARDGIGVQSSWRVALLTMSSSPVGQNSVRWNRSAIRQVELRCAAGERAPDSVMIVHLKHSRPERVGLPEELPARAVADLLHGYGLAVVLPGWAPAPADAKESGPGLSGGRPP
jgi:hypothetical protein